jgi:hypothetical protein
MRRAARLDVVAGWMGGGIMGTTTGGGVVDDALKGFTWSSGGGSKVKANGGRV